MNHSVRLCAPQEGNGGFHKLMGKRDVCRQDTLTLSLTTLLQGATISTFTLSFYLEDESYIPCDFID